MIGIVLILIAVLVFLFVLEPFLSARKLPNRFITRKQIRNKELYVRKEYLLESIRDLDLENATGMIPKEDYHKLRKAYFSRLKTISQELDGISAPDGVSDIKKKIETEVKIRRETSMAKVTAVISPVCPECSEENLPGSNFCSNCGGKL